MVSCVVAKSENEIDLDVFNNPNAGIVEEIDIDLDTQKEMAKTQE